MASSANPFAGRIVFVTGRQGAGKTALSNSLAEAHDFTHLDGDSWSGQPEVKEPLTSLCEFMMKYRQSENVEDEPEAWQPFYAAMCVEAIAMNAAATNGVLVSHSLFRRAHRTFVREKLGEAGLFLVLNPPAELALERAATRCAKQYETMGKSVEDWVGMLRVNSAGFQDYEPEADGEVEAFVLKNDGAEKSVEELLAKAEVILGLHLSQR